MLCISIIFNIDLIFYIVKHYIVYYIVYLNIDIFKNYKNTLYFIYILIFLSFIKIVYKPYYDILRFTFLRKCILVF